MRETIQNIHKRDRLTYDQWIQASLSMQNGGLGLRSVCSLAHSAFLASAAATLELQNEILLSQFHQLSDQPVSVGEMH